jgi:hypothetical protein
LEKRIANAKRNGKFSNASSSKENRKDFNKKQRDIIQDLVRNQSYLNEKPLLGRIFHPNQFSKNLEFKSTTKTHFESKKDLGPDKALHNLTERLEKYDNRNDSKDKIERGSVRSKTNKRPRDNLFASSRQKDQYIWNNQSTSGPNSYIRENSINNSSMPTAKKYFFGF